MKRGLTIVAALALAASGCATATQTGANEDTGDGPVELRFQSLAFQDTTIAATKKIVAAWNDAHPDEHVEYVQGSYDSVQDQLVTQFMGGTAPDIIQYESAAMTQFADQGYLADIGPGLSDEVRQSVPDAIWKTVTVDGKIIAAPTLLQSYVVFANKTLLEQAGVQVPTGDTWSWDDFQAAAKAATRDGTYGVGWGLGDPTATMVSLGLNFDGTYFSGTGADAKIDVGADELALPERIHAMAYDDDSLDPVTLTQSGGDVMTGFLRGQYAMTVQGSYNAQTLAESAPDGFEWAVLPPLSGTGPEQAANPQTLSVAAESPHEKEATDFINFYMQAQNLAQIAQGDWLIPASTDAADVVEQETGGANGWSTVLASGQYLTQAPFQSATGFPQWKDQIATPAFQRYFGDEISADELAEQLTDGWNDIN